MGGKTGDNQSSMGYSPPGGSGFREVNPGIFNSAPSPQRPEPDTSGMSTVGGAPPGWWDQGGAGQPSPNQSGMNSVGGAPRGWWDQGGAGQPSPQTQPDPTSSQYVGSNGMFDQDAYMKDLRSYRAPPDRFYRVPSPVQPEPDTSGMNTVGGAPPGWWDQGGGGRPSPVQPEPDTSGMITVGGAPRGWWDKGGGGRPSPNQSGMNTVGGAPPGWWDKGGRGQPSAGGYGFNRPYTSYLSEMLRN